MNESIHQSDLFATTPIANPSAAPPSPGPSGSTAGLAAPAEAAAAAAVPPEATAAEPVAAATPQIAPPVADEPAASSAPAAPAPPLPAQPAEPADSARSLAELRNSRPGDPEPDLAALAERCADCRRCGLAAGRQQVVVSRGNVRARLMVIGEGPGAQEDASGRPFVGRAGQLLDQMLASVGIDSERDSYIGNVVKCRPPDNRRPTPEEMAACLPFLLEQIALVDPAVILLAGATAMEGVLGIRGGITRLRGQWRRGEDGVLAGRWLMPVFHPSYLLRNASRDQGSPKWLTWQDLKAVKTRLDEG